MLDVLCLHGINTDEDSSWLQQWGGAIEDGSRSASGTPLVFHTLPWLFNAHFAKPEYKASGAAYATAFKRLWDSLWTHGFLKAARADQMADRNIIERTIGRLKDWRRIHTRYDKLAANFASAVAIAAILIGWT